MKRCSRCEREIPESATSCGQCGELSLAAVQSPAVWTTDPPPARMAAAIPAAPVAAPVAAATTPTPTPIPIPTPTTTTPTPTPPARGSKRRMLLAALLVVAGGTLTFAMLRSSAPAVPVTPRPKPAAAKPAAPKKTTATAPVAPSTTAPAATPSGTLPTAAPVAPAAAVVESKWSPANGEWLLNGRKGVAFELPSLKKVPVWQGISQPMLVVRCNEGRMQTFVYTSSAIQMEAQDENHSVGVSFDDEPEVIERWADSSDHDALFAPDALAFARRVAAARTLRLGYTPHNAQRAVAEFQVSGLSTLIEPAARQCGWKK
jgi:hypothetical protein